MRTALNIPFLLSAALLAALALGACSDDSTRSDSGGVRDGGGEGLPGSDAGLYPCTRPNLWCESHNPCAINPICRCNGSGGGRVCLCYPQSYQDCSDSLECTSDTCAGLGVCKNEPRPGFCALLVKDSAGSKMTCLKQGDKNPQDTCKYCNPAYSQSSWSPYSGGTCDDDNTCTRDDTCQSGVCKGTYYGNLCSDALECTTDTCDGKGGCSNKLQADRCVINKVCYKKDEVDSAGCNVCDVSKNQYAWTPRPNVCKVGAKCYVKGTLDSSGCGVCDPARNPNGWSPAPGKCLIQGICYSRGEKDSTGCAACDPATSSSSFTPLTGKCVIRGVCRSDNALSASGCGVCKHSSASSWWSPVSGSKTSVTSFDSGLGGYSVTAKVGGVGWQVSSKRKAAGAGSLYYGNPTSGNYDNGKINTGSATSGSITLPSGQKAALWFWLYMDTETSNNHDVLKVTIGGVTVWSKDTGSSTPLASFKNWVPVEVDLSPHAGKTIRISFEFDTKDAWSNSTEGVYLDEVTVVTGCGK